MRAWISHITGDDHLDDPAWGLPCVWEGEIEHIEEQLAASGLPLEQLVVGIEGAGTSWATDFLARRIG
jgi:hypothetical protein